MPAPQVLRQYDEVVPGLAREIVDMARREQAHRHDIERADVEIERLKVTEPARVITSGRRYAFVAMILVLAAGVWLVVTGHAVAGGVVLGLDIVGLVLAFIAGQAQTPDGSTGPGSPSPPADLDSPSDS